MVTIHNYMALERLLDEDNNLFVKDDLEISTNIIVKDIRAENIFGCNLFTIHAQDITARSFDGGGGNIEARTLEVYAGRINANKLNISGNIKAWDIEANIIKVNNIKANDIKANIINAYDIDYFAVCLAYESLRCHSIKGRRENSMHFCLDSEVIIENEIARLRRVVAEFERLKSLGLESEGG